MFIELSIKLFFRFSLIGVIFFKILKILDLYIWGDFVVFIRSNYSIYIGIIMNGLFRIKKLYKYFCKVKFVSEIFGMWKF